VANRDSRSLGVIDLSRFQLLKEVPLEMSPDEVLAAPVSNRAFVFSAGSSFAHIIDLESMQLRGRIGFRGAFVTARISPDGRLLWMVVRDPNTILSFDTATGERKARVALPAVVDDIDIFENRIALVATKLHTVFCFDEKSGRLGSSIELNAAPNAVCWRNDGKVLLTANTDDNSITVLDAATTKPMVDLQLPLAPRHMCMNTDGGQMFVTGAGLDAVSIVSPYQTEVNETVLAGHKPGEMAATSSGPQYLFLSNPDSGEVSVIHIDNRRVIAQIPVGQRPGRIALTPDNEYALVLNEESGDVAVIRLLNIREASLSARRSRTAPLFTMIPIGVHPVSVAIAPRLV
jgi:YVTN family beta-propeller protein